MLALPIHVFFGGNIVLHANQRADLSLSHTDVRNNILSFSFLNRH